MMMFHVDDAFRAARGLYMTQKEVNSCFVLFTTLLHKNVLQPFSVVVF